MYSLRGTYYNGWNFKCYLNNRYIGEGALSNGIISIEKRKESIRFREKDIRFSITNDEEHDRYHEIHGFGDPIDCKHTCSIELKTQDDEYTFCGFNNDEMWMIDHCYLEEKRIGDGYLNDAYNVIYITDKDKCMFFHGKCVYFKLESKCNKDHSDRILAEGHAKIPMIITKHVPCTFEIKQKIKLITLNEPWINLNEKFYSHPSLFVNKETEVIQTSPYRYDNDFCVPVTLKCPCCDEIVDLWYY